MISPTKQDWRAAELLADPQKLFVLWAVKVGFCARLEDFREHFGADLSADTLVAELQQEGFLRKGAAPLRLTALGDQTVSYLNDTEPAANARPAHRHGKATPAHVADKKPGVLERRRTAQAAAARAQRQPALVRLEVLIDECLAFASRLDPEPLAKVIKHLRQARKAVVGRQAK
jgi:hypothetical protein